MDQHASSIEERISIIENSLKQASSQKTGASKYYIIWGITLTVFFIVQYIHAHFRTSVTATMSNISMLFFALGGLMSFLQSKTDKQTETVIPLNEKLYGFAWSGAGISLGVVCIAFQQNIIEIFCIAVVLIFGLVNFIIGGVTNFKPLIIGGFISILLCILIKYCAIEYKFLVAAFCMIITCVVPGLMMKSSNANV